MQRRARALSVLLALIASPVAAQTAQRLKIVSGFDVPESARYDAQRDAWYVSNVTGHPLREDNTGFISLMDPEGTVTQRSFIAGGANGVTLNAPKGMALVGDTLWVADIRVLRGFHRVTGRPIASIAIPSAGFLNDVTVAPDGSLYLSDTGFREDSTGRMRHPGPDRIYRVRRPATVDVVVEGPELLAPNGVFWDRANDRLLIGAFSGKAILAWKEGRGLSRIAEGPGGYDGIEATPEGEILFSSQDGKQIVALRGSTLVPIITGVEDMGDIGIDTRRRRIAIPRLDTGLLELWQLPPK